MNLEALEAIGHRAHRNRERERRNTVLHQREDSCGFVLGILKEERESNIEGGGEVGANSIT